MRQLAGSFAKAVSLEVAKCMTYAGFNIPSGYQLEEGLQAVCISCTASLAKDGEREGREHHACIGVSFYNSETNTVKFLYELKLKPGRTRLEEENLLSEFLVLLAFNVLTESNWHISSHEEAYELIGLTKDEIIETKIIEKKKKEIKNEEPTISSEE